MNLRQGIATVALAAGMVLSAAPSRLWGQAVTATLLGTVTDASGAVVPNAKVTATEVNTNVSRATQTNDSGNYTFPYLAPGRYDVMVEQQGFKKEVRRSIDVLVDTTARVDARLEPGQLTEIVNVTSEAPLLQTDRADTGRKIEEKQIKDLPLGTNRNFQGLLNLVPGTNRAHRDHSEFFNSQYSLSSEVNGNSRMANNLQLEGVDDNERTGLMNVYIPPIEAVQTVDVSTSNYEAELGRAGGAVTNVMLKSGTNNLHGSAYAFYRSGGLNARGFFDRGPGGKPFLKPKTVYHYDGFSLGGPLKKDKIFFFGDFLRISDLRGQTDNFFLPAEAFRRGDFSSALGNFFCTDSSTPSTPCGSNGKTPVMITTTEGGSTPARANMVFDPNTGNSDGSGRRVFSSEGKVNAIPNSRFDSIAQKVLLLVPPPNSSGQQNNFTQSSAFVKTTTSFDIKVDMNPNQNNRLSARFSYSKPVVTDPPAFGLAGGPHAVGFQGTGQQKTYVPGFNWDHTFSPTLISETRFGINRYRNDAQQTDYGSKASEAIGVPGVNTDAFTSGLFAVEFPNSGFSNPLVGYSGSLPWVRAETNILAVNTWTKTHRNHAFKWGADVRRIRDDLLQTNQINPRGRFQFTAGQTALKGGPPTNFANSFASFLIGAPNSVGRDFLVNTPASRITQFFAFGQDKWQVFPKLTLDLGLRWEFYPPATPAHPGGFSNYDPATNSLVLAGIGNNPMNLGVETRYTNFAPRVGVAYRLSAKTVVRSGFGISYEPFPDNHYAFAFPVKQNNDFTNGGNTFGPAKLPDGTNATFAKGFPAPAIFPIPANGIIAISDLPKKDRDLLTAQFYEVVNKSFKNAYVEAWNLSVQRALPHNLSFEVAYVGNRGVDIPTTYNLNASSVAGAGSSGQPLFARFGRTAGTNLLYAGNSSTYHSLQAKLDHKFSGGFLMTTAYTYSKALAYKTDAPGGAVGGLQDYIHQRRNYAPVNFDRTHIFVQSYVYELPLGKGKKYLTSGWANQVLGGWQVTGILTLQTGQRLNFGDCSNSGCTGFNTPGNEQRPNFSPPFKKLYGVDTQPWFDSKVFSRPSPATSFGNLGRNAFSGPGFFGLDASLFKRFVLTERVGLELRAEALGATNTPRFENPNVTFGNNNFGFITQSTGERTMQLGAKVNF